MVERFDARGGLDWSVPENCSRCNCGFEGKEVVISVQRNGRFIGHFCSWECREAGEVVVVHNVDDSDIGGGDVDGGDESD